MTNITALPVEILRKILRHFRPSYCDDSEMIRVGCVTQLWADILVDDFRSKYDFLDKAFVEETWKYLTLSDASFLKATGYAYARNLPSKRTSLEYCMIWVEDFRLQKREMVQPSRDEKYISARAGVPEAVQDVEQTDLHCGSGLQGSGGDDQSEVIPFAYLSHCSIYVSLMQLGSNSMDSAQ